MKRKVSPVLIIIASFLFAIVVGMLLFKLPISTNEGHSISWVDSLFLSTSALCVTGLSPVADVGATLSIFGRIVLAILIQLGGLGIVTVVSYVAYILGARFGIGDRYLLKEALNQNKISNILKLLISILKITIIFELTGAILSFIGFVQHYDVATSIGYSLFHSISAFNNAGFDILGDSSLINFTNDVYLNVVTMILIVSGGLGFVVIHDIVSKKGNYKKFNIHTKIVLTMTIALIVFGLLSVKLSMGDNINWLQATFLSVTARTAGFATINSATLNAGASLIMCMLMVVGASPSSTGGGIKTTTLYTITKSVIGFARGKPAMTKQKRKISEESKIKAFALFFFAIAVICLSIFALIMLERNNPAATGETILFETCSAFGTVGLSMGLTTTLSAGSKIILCILMFLGRLGPITIMGLWNKNWNKPETNNIEYIEEKIIIG